MKASAEQVLAAYAAEPGDAAVIEALALCRRAAASSIAAWPAARKAEAEVEALVEIVRLYAESGAADLPVAGEDLALAETCRRRGWPGLLAAMLLVPAWQWPAAPGMDGVPPWLLARYAAYVFHAPQGFVAGGQARAYGDHYLRRLQELARMAEHNRGSAAVRAALTVYRRAGSCIPLYFSPGSLRRHYELRGRILRAAVGGDAGAELAPRARAGRRLRVGFLNRHFGPQTETYTTLPTFEQLDPARFEVLLYTHRTTHLPLEKYARSRAAGFFELPAELGAQVEMLRAADLDVVVFGTNLTAVCNEVTQLALFRVAPLQVVNNSSCTTTGLPEVDLYVSGDLTEVPGAQAHFSERLGLLPGPAHAFNYEADAQGATATFTREALGIPADAVVFVSAANYFKVIPEMQHAWAAILAAIPGSRLVVHPFNPNWSSTYPIKRFCAEFDRVLLAHGVSPDRLVVSTTRFPSRADVKELLRVGDVYLDSYPFGGVNSLVDPLQAGLPVVVWEGEHFRSRMGGALLRALGLEDLIARDEAGYRALVVRLVKDAAWRLAVRDRIQAAMDREPIFLDALAHSEAFGALLETAFDELAAQGRAAFRAATVPLTAPRPADPDAVAADGFKRLAAGCADEAEAVARTVLGSNPSSPRARHLLGKALFAQGRAERAVAYYLAAVARDEGNSALWFDLASGLCSVGRLADALQAIQASARLEPRRLETWLLLGEFAARGGNPAILEKAVAVAQLLAPTDPRTAQLARLEAAAGGRSAGVDPGLKPAAGAAAPGSTADAAPPLGGAEAEEKRARQAVAHEPHSAKAHFRLGLALLRLERSADAIRELGCATQLEPGQARYWRKLGEVLLRFDAFAKAALVLENAAQIGPDDADTWALLAEARLQAKDFGGAEAAAERAVAAQPRHAGALMCLGHLRKRHGRLDEALALHRRAVGALPVPAAARRPKPRVVFVVQHGPMWTTLESVYRAFAADPAWDTVVVAVPYLGTFVPGGAYDRSLAILDYLKQEGIPFVRWDEFPLEPGCADLLFLPKPHDHTRPPDWRACNLLRFVPRLAYVPYGLEIGGGDFNAHLQWDLPLQRLAWMVFARSARQKALYGQHCAAGNAHLVVTGHPKMDAIRDLEARRDPELEAWRAGRKLVVWNAQYDVRPDGTPRPPGYSTFLHWRDFLPAEFARRPGLALLLRPHPIFFAILRQRGVLTEEQIEAFFARCGATGNIAVDRRPSYLPAFASSTAMLSDASSFLLEYAGTGRPLLYLRNPKGPGLNADGQFITSHCYVAETEDQMRRFLDLIEAGQDPGGPARRARYAEFMHRPPEGVGAAVKSAVEERLRREAALS